MKCTTVDLEMSERAGVEIDYCPNCRGIWLDRGELDRILQRMNAYEDEMTTARRRDDDDDDYRYKKRPKSWWRELFD